MSSRGTVEYLVRMSVRHLQLFSANSRSRSHFIRAVLPHRNPSQLRSAPHSQPIRRGSHRFPGTESEQFWRYKSCPVINQPPWMPTRHCTMMLRANVILIQGVLPTGLDQQRHPCAACAVAIHATSPLFTPSHYPAIL